MSLSKDEGLELQVKKEACSCFVNNCFNVGLKDWQANLDIQPVFNEYKAVTYMCPYFPKAEDGYSQAMKQVAKEAFENNMHHHDTMETIAKAYLSNQECSVQEAVFKLRRIVPAVYFVNTNPQEEIVQVLFY